jgi:hypothetical protein
MFRNPTGKLSETGEHIPAFGAPERGTVCIARNSAATGIIFRAGYSASESRELRDPLSRFLSASGKQAPIGHLCARCRTGIHTYFYNLPTGRGVNEDGVRCHRNSALSFGLLFRGDVAGKGSNVSALLDLQRAYDVGVRGRARQTGRTGRSCCVIERPSSTLGRSGLGGCGTPEGAHLPKLPFEHKKAS